MKKIFLILSFAIVAGFVHSQTTDTVFYETGKIKIIRTIISDSEVYGKFFAENGKTLIAEGMYVNKERNGVWVFYDDAGMKNSTETYSAGKKNGISHIYYSDGTIGETLEWKDGIKNGVWKQFFFGGILKIDAKYLNNELDGEVKFFHPNSKLNILGYYKNGLRNGIWKYYNEEGSFIKEEKYENGFLVE
ncbi:MAG: hypothetical protein LBP67_09430 [Bacteroidales bacterium]|jgi:antitoxin component YwqK of YwqJK toxin-antitoxin module|nr:hypothetical protein [Bacteroidales bacterium]